MLLLDGSSSLLFVALFNPTAHCARRNVWLQFLVVFCIHNFSVLLMEDDLGPDYVVCPDQWCVAHETRAVAGNGLCSWTCPPALLQGPGEERAPANPLVPERGWETQELEQPQPPHTLLSAAGFPSWPAKQDQESNAWWVRLWVFEVVRMQLSLVNIPG